MPRGVNAYDEARLQHRLWTPEVIRHKLVLWQPFHDVSRVTCGPSGVTAFRAGVGPDLTAEAGEEPACAGGRGLLFSRDTDMLSSERLFATNDWVIGLTMLATANALSIDGDGAYMGQYQVGADGRWFMGTRGESYGMFSWTPRLNITTSTPVLTDQYVMVGFTNASNFRYWLNGAAIDTRSAGGTGAPADRRMAYGRESVGSDRHLDGYFFEAIAGYGITESERQAYEGYVNWLLRTLTGQTTNLPADHPFRNRPPLIGD